MMNWTWFHKLGSPKWFYEISGPLAALVRRGGGAADRHRLRLGLAFAPPDYQQGNSFRIIYIHVPAASLAQSLLRHAGRGRCRRADLEDEDRRRGGAVRRSHRRLDDLRRAAYRGRMGQADLGRLVGLGRSLTAMLILLFLYFGIIAPARRSVTATARPRPVPYWPSSAW